MLHLSMRILALLPAIALLCVPLFGQVLRGALLNVTERPWLTLFDTRGASHTALDSVRCDARGRFRFDHPPVPFAGFYQLSVHDTDRVDIILDPREAEVVLEFSGTPLQEHITVLRSEENLRLWEYKAVSRETQAIQRAVEAERRTLRPDQVVRSRELDTLAARADHMRSAHLDQMIQKAPDRYFARVVQADRALMAVQRKTPRDVLRAFPFDDESLLHSAVYSQAVLSYLRNLEAVSEQQFVFAADTLIQATGSCSPCRSFLSGYLVEAFGNYGPDLALQHVLDRYLTDTSAVGQLPEGARVKVRGALRVRIGQRAPELKLSAPGQDTTMLSMIWGSNRATLLFFYSSACDHCHEQMPGLRVLYTRYRPKGLQIVGLSLDEEPGPFLETIRDESLIFPCYSEFKGWSSSAAKTFAVQATPAFFLLDDQGKIIAKPFDHQEAEIVLKGLFP
ncbi:MAG: TlpA family protein disulfide reductase [Flavobacteriales bacterium]|nr:TlpA family protein disulfide reductase [Flavobacteriales bacterium]